MRRVLSTSRSYAYAAPNFFQDQSNHLSTAVLPSSKQLHPPNIFTNRHNIRSASSMSDPSDRSKSVAALGQMGTSVLHNLLKAQAKTIVLSGPSGYVGKRVLNFLLHLQQARIDEGCNPGKIVLLSSSPGNLMNRLYNQYGKEMMKNCAASRADYFTHHDVDTWIDHLGSLGLGKGIVFIIIITLAGFVFIRCTIALQSLEYLFIISL
jgi:hypothetical protein